MTPRGGNRHGSKTVRRGYNARTLMYVNVSWLDGDRFGSDVPDQRLEKKCLISLLSIYEIIFL